MIYMAYIYYILPITLYIQYIYTMYHILYIRYYTIGGLMRVGFGEAGANVIAKNLAESSGGRLNLMG